MKVVEKTFEHRIRQQIVIDDMQFGFMKGKGTTDATMPFLWQDRCRRIFTARCCASAVLAMGLCLCLSVCLSQVGVQRKRLNVGSPKQHHTIAQGLRFSDVKDLREIRPVSPPTGAPNAGGEGQNR